MNIIDAHSHIAVDDEEGIRFLRESNIRLLNISIGMSADGSWRSSPEFWGADHYQDLAAKHPGQFAWCTSFDPPVADDAHYADRVIAGLDADFARGAVACKIWKNIGMEVRDAEGGYVMVDDPLFEPILRHLERMERTLIMHVGEPKACWEPLDSGSHHAGYYRDNPEWHMHGRSDVPSYEQLLAARDRVLARHPRLRVVGAHLGSHEHDVRELSARFDAYPNFAADTGARIYDLAIQDREVVRSFFERYSDRLIYGNDFCGGQPSSRLAPDERVQFLADVRRFFDDASAYYCGEMVTLRDTTLPGLGLSEELQQAFFEGNAMRWYPGL